VLLDTNAYSVNDLAAAQPRNTLARLASNNCWPTARAARPS
jgi:hypothetical protein